MQNQQQEEHELVLLKDVARLLKLDEWTLRWSWWPDDPEFPEPDRRGDDHPHVYRSQADLDAGRPPVPSQWEWRRLRPYLEAKTGRALPERFPHTGTVGKWLYSIAEWDTGELWTGLVIAGMVAFFGVPAVCNGVEVPAEVQFLFCALAVLGFVGGLCAAVVHHLVRLLWRR